VESATLAAIEADVLRPSVVERAVQLALDALGADRPDDRRSALRRELTRTEAELGVWPPPLPKAVRSRHWWARCRRGRHRAIPTQ
jgi:hypothetical protein